MGDGAKEPHGCPRCPTGTLTVEKWTPGWEDEAGVELRCAHCGWEYVLDEYDFLWLARLALDAGWLDQALSSGRSMDGPTNLARHIEADGADPREVWRKAREIE